MMATDRALAASDVYVVSRRAVAVPAVVSDYWAMTKPDVNSLIAITTAAAFYLGSPGGLANCPWIPLLHALFGTVLVASGAATLNQWMERQFDAKMRRTARRPVAAGRIEPRRALMVGTLLSVVGAGYLAVAANVLASLLAVVTLLSYLLLYTPLKRVTPLCTFIGAIPGAMPPLIGWAAARGHLDPEAWMLYAIVFLWQFPHFMAIAWMYRDDYERAGYLVLPHGQARVRVVIWQTVLPLLALLLVSLVRVLSGERSVLYGIAALLLSLGFWYHGVLFVRRRSGSAARQLLMASILYLPSLLVLMILQGW